MRKINIISGFLGAGKTTLIKKLLSEVFAGQKVVLIENEFGEIGIDGGFLKQAGIVVNELNAGCICCSLVGDFETALQQVVDTYAPDRILIEPSGVGKLSDVLNAVKKAKIDAEVESAVTVVDATRAKRYLENFGEFFENQVQNAGAILLTRTDKADEKQVADTVALLRAQNAKAPIVTTHLSQLSGEQLAQTLKGSADLAAELLHEVEHAHHHHEHHHEHGEGCGCGEHHHAHHEHGEGCGCGEHHHAHHHEHGEGCGCGEHHHEHGEGCGCGEHHHDHHEHGEGCGCGEHHHHEHGEGCGCGEHHHHDHGEGCSCGHDHHADEVFTAWGRETPKSYSEDELSHILAALDQNDHGTILRAKGMVPAKDGGAWIHFDFVPGEPELRRGAADYTGRLCVIGAALDENGLCKLFGLN